MSRILQMEALKNLWEKKSYTAAAKEMGITQSYLSKLIKKLEEHYHTELVARTQNGLVLTPAGEELYDSSCFILSEYYRIEQKLQQLSVSKENSLVVGITRNASMANFYVEISKFIATHPQIDVTTIEVHPEYFRDYLDMQRIDVAVGWYGSSSSRNYSVFPIVSGVWKLCVSNSHPLAARDEVFWKDLKDYEMILSSEDKHRSRLILEFQKKGFYPKIKHYAVFFYNVLELINMNQGIAPIPSTLDISNYKDIKTLDLLPELPCPFYVATRKGEEKSTVKEFLDYYTVQKHSPYSKSGL